MRAARKRPPLGSPSSLGDLAQEPRAILPVLDALDRQKNDKALLQLIERLEREDKLRLETLIFTLRLRFRADDYPSALQAVDMILALAPNNTEALRTGGRIGNLQKNDDVALWHWERLAAVSAADPEAALQAARIRARRQDHRQALDWAWRAAELRPESPEPLQIAAAAGLELGWPEVGDVLLSRLFTMDRTRALRITPAHDRAGQRERRAGAVIAGPAPSERPGCGRVGGQDLSGVGACRP